MALPTPYDGVDFQGFGFIKVVQTNLAPGVIPESGNTYVFSDAQQTTTSGSAEWTTKFAGSTIKSFTPLSFYYGCDTNLENGDVSGPQACNIAITCFQSGDNTAENVQVVSQEFSYNPSSPTAPQQMAEGIFNPEFENCQYVLIQYTSPGGSALASADLVLVVDNVVYTTCS